MQQSRDIFDALSSKKSLDEILRFLDERLEVKTQHKGISRALSNI